MADKTAVFTIVSLNYAAFARTLMESVRAVHPEWDRYVLLADRSDDPSDIGGDLFSSVMVEALPLPRAREFLFRYGVMELNTAVKPWMFTYLRAQGYQRVVYFDPDILVIDRLVELERLLDEGASAVVLPHLAAPMDDGCHPAELDIMRAGAYNLGFIAIGGTPSADAFIDWWKEKLEFGAVSDLERGLFTDQKWVDLAPGMFDGVAILRDTGYDVAYWNLSRREITRQGDALMAAGRPLRFFHFSGFDPENPKPFSKHQNRLTLDSIGPEARALALDYAGRVLGHGHAQSRTLQYGFGRFADGTPIPDVIRVLYREDAGIRRRAGDDPFASAQIFVCGEADGLPAILRAAWLHYRHVQRAFPDPLGAHRQNFYWWFVEFGATELGIPRPFVEPVRRALFTYLASERISLSEATHTITVGSIWTRILVSLHRRMKGANPSASRLLQYREVSGPIGFVRLGISQFLNTRWAGPFSSARPAPLGSDDRHAPPTHPRAAWTAAAHWRVPRLGRRFWGLFDEPGQDAWWMGPQARMVVDPSTGTTIRLRGTHHAEMHRRAHGRPALNIQVTIDEELRGAVTIHDPGPFDVSLDVGNLPADRPVVLGLVPERYFVPRDLGLGDDSRALSVQIAAIDLGGNTVFSVSHPPREQVPALGAPGVNVIGYARSEHGVGQSLRQFVGALDAAGIAANIIDFNEGNLSRIGDRGLEARLVSEPTHSINVFHINADQMPVAEMYMPAHVFERFNIGFWHWELPEMLPEHLAGFRRLNEVWVPTAFVQDAVSKASPVPVVRMPHGISFSVSPDADRRRFGLPDNRFLFLLMYDFSSFQERKNPNGAIEAFDRAFQRDHTKATLVIKTQNADLHPQDLAALGEKLAGRPDVVWINETLSRQAVYDLYSVCDALVSLHRSEGFGLSPAEAMFLGKPVIATNWSGNTDFMRQDNSLPVDFRLVKIERSVGVYRAGQVWADPDIDHAASLMRRVVDDGALRERISRAAMRTMREEFSPEIAGRRVRARLEYIQDALNGR